MTQRDSDNECICKTKEMKLKDYSEMEGVCYHWNNLTALENYVGRCKDVTGDTTDAILRVAVALEHIAVALARR